MNTNPMLHYITNPKHLKSVKTFQTLNYLHNNYDKLQNILFIKTCFIKCDLKKCVVFNCKS